MIYSNILLVLCMLTATSFSFAQSVSVYNKTNISFPKTFLLQSFQVTPYAPESYLFQNEYLRTNHSSLFFKKPIIYDNFGRRHFYYKYDTLNPWCASGPLDAIAGGTINYLIQSMDKKFFYRK